MQKSKTKSSNFIWFLALIVAAVFIYIVSPKLPSLAFLQRLAGPSPTEAIDKRLALVWPSFAAMPATDRLFLQNLSDNCKLHKQPATREAVTQCLRSASSSKDSILATKEMTNVEAERKLESLLPSPLTGR
jgi:hypothetical protein